MTLQATQATVKDGDICPVERMAQEIVSLINATDPQMRNRAVETVDLLGGCLFEKSISL